MKNNFIINILRGENELTGNLIEIEYNYTKLLVECGKSLEGDKKTLSDVEVQVLSTKYDAIVISHNHLDHNGLISKVNKAIPVYMGRISLEIYKVQNKKEDYSNYKTYYDGCPFKVGDITITPYLCDHSAPDSYMLLFENSCEKILYTGDFRSKGRKNFNDLLDRFPSKIDMLITEHTNQNGKKCYSEKTVENKVSELIKSTSKPVFVLCPTTNIDRIVSMYKASVKNKFEFFVDIEQEKILEIFSSSVPNAKTFKNVKVYYPRRTKDFSGFVDVKNKSISINEIASLSNYLMIVKTSTLPYLRKLIKLGADLNGATLVYSMWSGYKENDNMKKFLNEIESFGVNVETIHASGHADSKTIKTLAERVNPNEIRIVHTRGENNN